MAGVTVTPARSATGLIQPIIHTDVALVTVVNGNVQNMLRLLASVVQSSFSPSKILVVNNRCSLDITLAFHSFQASVPQHHLPLICLANPVNVSAARNVGWKVAESNSSSILFLDDDNTVDNYTVARLVQAMNSDSTIGAVSPVALLGTTDRVWCAGVARSKWTGRTRFAHELPPLATLESTWPTDDLPNAVCIRRDILERTGGYDEYNFPMHREESDLALRISALGFRTVTVAGAVVRHHTEDIRSPTQEVRRSMTHGGVARLELWARSRIVFQKRHIVGIQRFTIVLFGTWPWLAATVIGITFLRESLHWKGTVFKTIIQGLWAGYRWSVQDWPPDVRVPRETA
jgi:GT2 family glycosyltransferase